MEVQKKMQDSNNEGDDDLYESIYEVVNPPENMDCHDFDDDFDSESDFDEILEEDEVSGNFTTRKQRTLNRHQRQSYLPNGQPKQLSKFAEAAGKKMKKLRRNWSLKKNDITRSLSRIRKNSRPIFPTAGGEAIFRDALRRKPSRNPSFSSSGAAKSVVKCNGQALLPAGLHHSGVNSDGTMFYITLNIEDINGQNQSKESSNGDSSQSTSRSGSVISSQPPVRPPPPRPGSRKASSISNLSSSSGHKSHYAVVRPTEAPPAPPPSGFNKPRIASPSPSSDYGPPSRRPPPPPPSELSSIPASLLSGSNSPYREFYVGFSTSEDGSSNASSSELGLCGLDHVEETYTSSLFQTEPLYQFYDRELSSDSASSHSSETITNGAVDNKKSGETSGESTVENMYESVISRPSDILDNEVRRTSSNNNAPDLPPKQLRKLKSRSSAMDLVHNNARNGRRSMWTELPEVIESGILNSISLNEKKLQEALFEVVSSEASYLKSLNVLISHFVQSPKLIGDTSVISKRDYRILFSDVIAVRQCSEKFLEDLEKRWQDSVMLTGITPIVKAHASDNFQVYVKYCSNQVYQDRILRKLTAENPKFVETLRELESSPACQSLAMHSFLMLPMQRITRLPLLINAIYERLNAEHDGEENPEYASCKEALDTLNKLVKECNESARSMERMEELLILSQQLDFRDVRAVPLISASRWLVKRGEPTRLWWRENSEAKLTFGRSKVNRQQLCLFLFTDLLVITRKKNEENYLVMDHCPRNLVTLVELDSTEGIPGGGKYLSEQENHLAWLTLLQNHENKTLEWLISFGSQMDRLRWMEAVTPQTSENPEEKIYEEWDCPQIEGVQNYDAQDSDELALKKGETANVLRKLSDSGWMYLERRSDGHRGWVPMRVTREIESSHVRARNFKQRHAFLKLISSDAPDSLAASLATAVGAANVAAGNVGRSFSEE